MGVLVILTFVAVATAKPYPNEVDPEYMGINGDILLAPGEELGEMGPLNAIVNDRLCWPGGDIYYELTDQYDEEQVELIEAGIKDLVDSTKVNGDYCIQIHKRTNEPNYIRVGKNSGCSSAVGMRGGRQSMSLVDGCVTRHGTIMHEFLHAYGFYHEQSRYDRDEYIIVNEENVQAGRLHNFRKYSTSEIQLLGTPYDYESVMHYGPFGFAINPQVPTIQTIDPDAMEIIGQRLKLSDLDIERVQIFYNCVDPEDTKYFKNLARADLVQCTA